MALFSYQDYRDGLCTASQVGHPKDQPPTAKRVAPTDSRTLVQEYMEVFHEIGGRDALVKQAKLNPMKFYDQLLKLLVAMEAPKATVAVQVNLAQLSHEEITALPSHEIKRLLLEAKD